MKNPMKYIKYLLLLLLLILIPIFALARPFRPALLPDGGVNFGCSTCHFNPNGGGPRNPFGQDWEAIAIPRGDRYVPELGIRDSDGDGFTNDQEFAAGTRPGDATSKPVKTFIITAVADEHGSITPSGTMKLNEGSNQTFIITPDAGYRIKDVLVDGRSVGPVTTYTFTNIIADHHIRGTFILDATYIITATAGENGKITPSGQVQVRHGDDQTFTITPDARYHIRDVFVDGASVGIVTTYTFTNVTSAHTINATFEINTQTITATAGSHGNITPSGQIKVPVGENQTFNITADVGYHVQDVLVDGVSVGPVTTYTFTNVTADHTINATFAINIYSITATAGERGKIIPSGQVKIAYGDSQPFTIIPDEGYHIQNVIVDGASLGNITSYTFTNVTADHAINVIFDANVYTIIATAGENGSISPSGEVKAKYGENLAFVITPDEGYNVSAITVDGLPAFPGTSYTFTNVMADHTIHATFELKTYVIIAKAGDNGKITPSGEVRVKHGGNQAFTIAPNSGYVIADVLVDAKSVGRTGSYNFENIKSNHLIEAKFSAVTISAPDIIITPLSHDFGVVKIGNLSEPLIITISNAGSKELKVSGISLSGTPEFSIDLNAGPNPCKISGPTIVPGSSCTFAVTFRPLSSGIKEPPLTITSDDPDTPTIVIILKGTGTGIKGDVNEDGLVRSNDAILVLRMATGLLIPSDYQKWAADMNDDGNIRSNDAIIVLRKASGLAAPGVFSLVGGTNQINVILEKPSITNDKEIIIPLRVDDTTGLAGGDIQIAYDKAILRAIDVSQSDPDVLMISNLNEQGLIHIAFATESSINNRTLAEINFQRLDNGASKMKFKDIELYGHDASPIVSKGVDTEFKSWAIAPKDSVLLQNFPNPFNPETWITYQLKENAEVVIYIYSAAGKLIREINPGNKPAGLYINKDEAAYWDGTDKFGIPVGSGIYFYIIKAGNFNATRKMIVLQ